MARAALIALSTWALLFAVWMLFVDNGTRPEVLVGVGAAALATVGSELVRRQRIAGLRVRPRWLAQAWRPVVRVPLDVVTVMWALVLQLAGRRRRRGALRAVRFRGPGDDPESTARRALAESFGSLAPNTVVVGIDPGRELIVVHQLVPDGDPDTADPLRLR